MHFEHQEKVLNKLNKNLISLFQINPFPINIRHIISNMGRTK